MNNTKDYLHEQADIFAKDIIGNLKKIIESLEIGNGCEEAECLVIHTSTRCFLQNCEDLMEFITMLKLKAIVGGQVGSDETTADSAGKVLVDIKKYLSGIDSNEKGRDLNNSNKE